MATEDGWEPSPRIEPDAPLLVWKQVPGTDVTIQVRNDDAGTVMLAYAADYHKNVEPLRDADTACYTPTNSVSTSNHLNATAMDLNWNSHPFQTRGTFNADQMTRLRALLAYYDNVIFWAGDWDDPVDEMHHQMDYGSFGLEQNGQLGQWIKNHIGADGTSNYLHPDPTPTPDPVAYTRADAIQALYEAVEAFGMDDATKYLDQIVAGLTASKCNTVNRVAGWLAEVGEESGDFVYTEEINKSGPYAPYIGRTWIQITWETNYQQFGIWCVSQNLLGDPNYFVNNPAALADPKWAAIGPAWYWLVARPTINGLCDAGDLTSVTKLINGSGASQKTINNRQARYDHAMQVGDRLLALVNVGHIDQPTGGDYVPTQDEWNALVADVREIRNQLNGDATFDTGSSADAVKRVEDAHDSGKPMSLLDIATWLKNHVSTHKKATP